MKLAGVLTSCTIDPKYCKCLPLFIRAWCTLYPQVQVKVVFVHETVPEELAPYREHVVHFPPVEGLPVAFQSQYIRLLYPALLGEEDGVMVSDVDLAPMNRRYFSDSIRRFADDTFVSYRAPHRRTFSYRHQFADDGVTKLQKPEERTKVFPEIYLPGNTASSKVWAEIFGVQSGEDVPGKLLGVWKKYHGKTNDWHIDQIDLAFKVEAWDSETHRHVCVPRRAWHPRRLQLPTIYVRRNRALKLESNRFVSSLLRLCVRLGIFSDYQMCLTRYNIATEVEDKIMIGWLSSRPSPWWIAPVQPLILLTYRGLMFAYRAIEKGRKRAVRVKF